MQMLLNNQNQSDLDLDETINIYNNLFLKLTVTYKVIFYFDFYSVYLFS